MFRPVVKGRAPHATHRGIDECRAFADRFAANGIQFVLEDILVNGGPWRTLVAMRVHSFLPSSDGDKYSNRAIALLELRWGKLVVWEDYEDTERVAAWDRSESTAAAG
jgi:ketosteroid isomerase-like protein